MAVTFSAIIETKEKCPECAIPEKEMQGIKEDKIILYSTGCPKCKVLKKKLDVNGIKYEVVSDTNVMQEKGFTSAPILEVNGECMDFTKANNWVKEHMTNER